MSNSAEQTSSDEEPAEPAEPCSPTEALGVHLRDLFGHIADQAIPDRINRLVDKLEAERRDVDSDRRS